MAFVALCNGDSSGVEAIGKIILYIGLFIGVGLIIAYVPWLLLIGIVIAIVVAVASSSNGNKYSTHNTTSINYTDYYGKEEKIEMPLIDNSNLTDFQKQLQENTKTPQQVEDENWIKESENIKKNAEEDYSAIKQSLLQMAQSGKYTIVNDRKCVKIDFPYAHIQEYIKRTHSSNPTGKRGTNSYKKNEKVYYTLDKVKQYELYMKIIKEYASCDNIDIEPYFVEIMDTPLEKYKHRVSLPYTYSHDFWTHDHKVKVYLDCSIVY